VTYDQVYQGTHTLYLNIIYELNIGYGPDWTRADFACKVKEQAENPAMMFALHDGKDIGPMIWKTLRQSEDVT
jgi:hypothetical protein